MPKQLTIDEMLDLARELDLPNYDHFVIQFEALATSIAHVIAQKLDVNAGAATYQGLQYAGMCAPFGPRTEDQACPDVLEPFDQGSGPEDNNWDWDADIVIATDRLERG